MADPKQDTPIVQIYNQINGLFGGKPGQMFSMEFPGRLLDIGTYAYANSATIDAQQTKPQAVAEAEFQLSDDLFNIAELTGGPNGKKLSEVYCDILGALIPAAEHDNAITQQLFPDQLLITNWLLELVTDWNPPEDDILSDLPQAYEQHVPPKKKIRVPKPVDGAAPAPHELGKIPRVDLYQKLVDAYEDERFRWEQFKLNARPTDDKDTKAWDKYNRTLSVFAPTIDKKLEGLWTTVLIRGQYHRVRHFIGLVDVESSSEALLRAKETLRASVVRSVDDTEDIYPVQFQPASWANYLTTDFNPVDLLADPSVIRAQMLDKQEQRRTLIARLGVLQSAQQDVSGLQKKADDALSAYNDATNKLMSGFSDAAISLVQLYFKQKGAKTQAEVQAVEKTDLDSVLKANSQPPLTDAQFQQIKDMQSAAIQNQTSYLTAAENVARSQAALAGGIASDPKLALAETQDQIDSLTAQIETLRTLLDSAPANTNTTGIDSTTKQPAEQAPRPVSGDTPVPPAPKVGASEWEQIVITYDHTKKKQDSSLSSSASQTSWNVSFFIGSASGSSSESSGTSSESMTSDNTSVQVAFNAMKVQINRPWFDATILDNTVDFMRLSSLPISKGDKWLDVMNSTTATQAQKMAAMQDAEKDTLMASFPIAFIIAKDVTINLSNSFTSAGSAKSYVEKNTATGGGILCFSMSHSSHSSTSAQSAYSEVDDKHINIRIPGPQILGWIMQVVPEDKAVTKYTHIDAAQFKLGSDPNVTPAPASK